MGASRNHLGIVPCRSPRTPLPNPFFKIPRLWPLRKQTVRVSLLLGHLLGGSYLRLPFLGPRLPSPAGTGAPAPAWWSCSALRWPGDLKTSGPAIPSPSPCSVYARSPSSPTPGQRRAQLCFLLEDVSSGRRPRRGGAPPLGKRLQRVTKCGL